MSLTVTSRTFGRLIDGRVASLFTLANSRGACVSFTNYGVALVSAIMPDKAGTLGHVALGFDTLAAYEADETYIGVVIGPVANRIGGAQFSLGTQAYSLHANDSKNCLHSGANGWHSKLWDVVANDDGLSFTYQTQNGENGFPGIVSAKIEVSLSEDNRLTYRFHATTSADSPISMTRHEYFNLNDGGASKIDNHIITIPSASIAQLNEQNIATGELLSVTDATVDLRQPTTLSSFKTKSGALTFDHHFIIAEQGLRHMARVESPSSGRRLDVFGTSDGVQFYTGQHLPEVTGHDQQSYGPTHGFALEPQSRPNAVNIISFPSIILQPHETYQETIIYAFSLID